MVGAEVVVVPVAFADMADEFHEMLGFEDDHADMADELHEMFGFEDDRTDMLFLVRKQADVAVELGMIQEPSFLAADPNTPVGLGIAVEESESHAEGYIQNDHVNLVLVLDEAVLVTL